MSKARFRRLIIVSLGVLLAMAFAAPAFADPVNGSQAFITQPLACDNGQTVILVTPSESAPVAQVIGTNQVLVVTRLTNVAMVEGVTIFEETKTFASSNGQAKGLQDSLVTCGTDYQFEDPDLGFVTGHFALTGFLTPR